MTPESLAALHALAFDEGPRPWTATEFAALLTLETTILATVPAGFALGRVALPEAELLTLVVGPSARRRGFGLALVEAFETEAAARGAGEAFLEVAGTNTSARALYERLGYRTVGRRPGYYRSAAAAPIDGLILRKRLPPPPKGH